MEGINLRDLIRKRGTGYRCLVEAIVDHETAPDDPLTPKVLKGARGVGYDFWNWNGDYRTIALAVEWESGGEACNYIETYRRKGEVRKPITEIKFICGVSRDHVAEVIPKKNKNPFVIRNRLK